MDEDATPHVALPTYTTPPAGTDQLRHWLLGALPRKLPIGFRCPRARDVLPLVPETLWKPIDYRHRAGHTRDQDGQGACVGFAASKALYSAMQSIGIDCPELSAGHVYGRINAGRDQGAMLADAIEVLAEEGVCPSTLVPDLEWHKRNWPSDTAERAKRYRVVKYLDCPTFPEIMSAIQAGKIGAFAIDVGNDFEVDADGWLHDLRGSRGGHALPCLGADYHAQRQTWGLLAQNSWDQDWGLGGYAYVPRSYFRGDWNDFWAIEVTTSPSSNQ